MPNDRHCNCIENGEVVFENGDSILFVGHGFGGDGRAPRRLWKRR
jgi:hypothetical protein